MSESNAMASCVCGWRGEWCELRFNPHPSDRRLSCPHCGIWFGYGCSICHSLMLQDGSCPVHGFVIDPSTGDGTQGCTHWCHAPKQEPTQLIYDYQHPKHCSVCNGLSVVIPISIMPDGNCKFTADELRAIEDSVKREIDGQDELRQAIGYAYYNGLGWRMTKALQVIDRAIK